MGAMDQAQVSRWLRDVALWFARVYLFVALSIGWGTLAITYKEGNEYSMPRDQVTTSQRFAICLGIGLLWPWIIMDEVKQQGAGQH